MVAHVRRPLLWDKFWAGFLTPLPSEAWWITSFEWPPTRKQTDVVHKLASRNSGVGRHSTARRSPSYS
jgi:hypothetical protein